MDSSTSDYIIKKPDLVIYCCSGDRPVDYAGEWSSVDAYRRKMLTVNFLGTGNFFIKKKHPIRCDYIIIINEADVIHSVE